MLFNVQDNLDPQNPEGTNPAHEVSKQIMNRINRTLQAFLILFLGMTVICTAQKKGRTTAKPSETRGAPLGLKCPEGEPNQPRPKFENFWIGDITSKAIKLPQPEYPQNAKALGIKGRVRAEVVMDILVAKPVWARTLSGHPFLRMAVNKVICGAVFSASKIDGTNIRVRGFVTYKFDGR